jgi:hypothetical protein
MNMKELREALDRLAAGDGTSQSVPDDAMVAVAVPVDGGAVRPWLVGEVADATDGSGGRWLLLVPMSCGDGCGGCGGCGAGEDKDGEESDD